MSEPNAVLEQLLRYDLACLHELEAARREQTADTAEAGLPLFQAASDAPPAGARLVGFDEAGRGALAGPVAVGCVSFPRAACDTAEFRNVLAGLNDSKQVSPKQRDRLYEVILTQGVAKVGFSSAHEVDCIGIVSACRLAALRALRGLDPIDHLGLALFDRGLCLDKREGEFMLPSREITKGDSTSLHVAAASILAKVARDRLMQHLDPKFPGYGLAKHKGYGTAAHREAIQELGPSPIHRRTFLQSILET